MQGSCFTFLWLPVKVYRKKTIAHYAYRVVRKVSRQVLTSSDIDRLKEILSVSAIVINKVTITPETYALYLVKFKNWH